MNFEITYKLDYGDNPIILGVTPIEGNETKLTVVKENLTTEDFRYYTNEQLDIFQAAMKIYIENVQVDTSNNLIQGLLDGLKPRI